MTDRGTTVTVRGDKDSPYASKTGVMLSFVVVLLWIMVIALWAGSQLEDAQRRIGQLESRCTEVSK